MKLTGKELEQRLKDDFIDCRSCGHVPDREDAYIDYIDEGFEIDKDEFNKICNQFYLF